MPPLGPLLWLLLLAWFPISLRGCLQCDQKFKENVAKLRTEIVPSKIQDSRLKERAEVLLSGLEGNFFLHYATSQFSGLAVKSKVDALIHEARFSTESLLQTHLTDQALLDELVEFRRKMTMKLKEALKEHQMKACDKSACVDAQERLSLRFGKPIKDPDIAKNGVAVVLCMGGLFFVVMIGVIIRYWKNRLFLYI
ncbi:izumo sperm-egg fusion protein 2 isoform X2 [Podarcis raffonei]|uniref:izumo sperm-egg fusion protein 2 isoform X2 n=1 Tax=Podarcis raffonei TaxID=65483 RepID=UPI0023296210|nr:izumo sperm-egg fusion protein 2 isoform X2 [Podarcis raffonei]